MQHRYVLLLGSNLEDRYMKLSQAIEFLIKFGEFICKSKLYETAAWGKQDQPSFLNQILILNSHYEPEQFLKLIFLIEKELGRQREVKWGARTMDVDILYCNSIIYNSQNLIIPHPELHNRKFTLIPLNDVDPNYLHPLIKKTNRELLAICEDPLPVKEFLPKDTIA